MVHTSSKTRYTKLSEDDVEANSLVVGVPSSSSPCDSLEKGSCKPQLKKRTFYYIFSSIMGFLFLLLTVAALAYGYFWTRHQVKQYTVIRKGGNGLTFPIHEMSLAEFQTVIDRSKLFWDTIKAGHVPEKDLVITADELNGFIAQSDFLRGNAYVTLEDGESSFVKVEMNVPVDNLPGGNGRSFVATGRLDVKHEVEHDDETGALLTLRVDAASPFKTPTTLEGELFLYWRNLNNNSNDRTHYELFMNVLRGEFQGRRGKSRVGQVSQEFIDRKENLLHILYEDDDDDDDDVHDVTAFLDGIESISIENSALVVRARRTTNSNNKKGRDDKNNNRMNVWSRNIGRKLQALSSWVF